MAGIPPEPTLSAVEPLNRVFSANGSDLSPPVSGDFNLVVVLDPDVTSLPTPEGYQGVVLLSDVYAPIMLHGDFALISFGDETITGGDGNDTINALAGSDFVLFGSGDTTVYGAAGDTIGVFDGGADSVSVAIMFDAGSNPIVATSSAAGVLINDGAADTLNGGTASATIIGASGDDITSGAGSDTVNALAGNETVRFGSGDATVYGGVGDTIGAAITFDAGSNPIVATSSSAGLLIADGTGDRLTGGASDATINGAAGDDIMLQGGADTVNATAGDETVTFGNGYANATVYGAAGDTIGAWAGEFANYLSGPDVIFNAGTNPIAVTSTDGSVLINSGAGDTITGGSAPDIGSGLPEVAAALVIGATGDRIILGDAADTVSALAGNETVTLGTGTVYGAAGDTIGSARGTLVTMTGGTNPIVVIGSTIGAGVNDTLSGGSVSELFTGASGDSLTLGAGADTVNALSGNEAIAFGNGNATVYGAAGDTIGDVVTFSAGGNPIVVTAVSGSVTINAGANDTLTGVAGAELVGASGDAISLRSGADTVDAMAGNEAIQIGGGRATIYGGAGDTVTAGFGPATIDFLSAAGQTFIDASSTLIGYNDTISDFSESNGDRIHLITDTTSDALANSTQVNGGQDTLIRLSDSSTILLKGVSSINASFFS